MAKTDIAKVSEGGLAVLQGGGTAALLQTIKALGIGQFDLQRIKVPSGGAKAWSVSTPEGEKSADEIQCVIAGFKAGQRSWWRDENAGSVPPNCSSSDGINGFGDNSVAGKAGQQGEHLCAQCPWFQWGSNRKGGRGKDCKDGMAVYFFMPESKLPSLFMVPPTSLKAMRSYLIGLVGSGHHCASVLTSLTLRGSKNDKGKDYSMVVPRMLRSLSAQEAGAMKEVSDGLMAAVDQSAPIAADHETE
jgi:hypothetical protein